MASPALSSFTVGIGFQVDEQSARRTADNFAMLKKKALGLGAALAGAFGAQSLVTNNANFVDSLAKTGATMGMTADALAAWQGVMGEWGLTAGQATGQLNSLFNVLKELQSMDPESRMETMMMARLSPDLLMGVTDPGQALKLLAGSLEGRTPLQIRDALGALGLDDLTGPMLGAGKGALESQFENIDRQLTISKELVESSAKFNDNLAELQRHLLDLGLVVTEKVLPPINKFLERVNYFAETPERAREEIKESTIMQAISARGGPITASGVPIGASSTAQSDQLQGDVYLDGSNVGRWFTKFYEQYNAQQLGGATGTQ